MTRQIHRPRRMRKSFAAHLVRAGALGLILAAPAAARAEPGEAMFSSVDGQEIGSAHLTDTPNGLLIELDLSGLPAESWVGFHIHENGACDAQDGFKSAGGHFAGAAGAHGFLTEDGPH
ncbi:superoxide dismutase family protein, partial [Cribrihabitans sp. XS_ASV171]